MENIVSNWAINHIERHKNNLVVPAGSKDKFFRKISDKIKRSNINYTVNVYLAENAIRYYRKAKELHTEGKEYKDKIRDLYFLDDDLNNDTCQFLFARERYLINSGVVDERLEVLKRLFPQSPLYKVESYLEEFDEERW